jgi:hypothetical protein
MENFFSRYGLKYCSIYEIYPESETPHLTQIAHLDLHSSKNPPSFLLPRIVIWNNFYEDRIVFIIWDYRLNHSISFSVDVDVEKFEYDLRVYFILSKALKLVSNSFVGR